MKDGSASASESAIGQKTLKRRSIDGCVERAGHATVSRCRNESESESEESDGMLTRLVVYHAFVRPITCWEISPRYRFRVCHEVPQRDRDANMLITQPDTFSITRFSHLDSTTASDASIMQYSCTSVFLLYNVRYAAHILYWLHIILELSENRRMGQPLYHRAWACESVLLGGHS